MVSILCGLCLKTPLNWPRAPLKPIPVEVPFDRVARDVLGPFPTSEKGSNM